MFYGIRKGPYLSENDGHLPFFYGWTLLGDNHPFHQHGRRDVMCSLIFHAVKVQILDHERKKKMKMNVLDVGGWVVG